MNSILKEPLLDLINTAKDRCHIYAKRMEMLSSRYDDRVVEIITTTKWLYFFKRDIHVFAKFGVVKCDRNYQNRHYSKFSTYVAHSHLSTLVRYYDYINAIESEVVTLSKQQYTELMDNVEWLLHACSEANYDNIVNDIEKHLSQVIDCTEIWEMR